jgi:hypothetical protein
MFLALLTVGLLSACTTTNAPLMGGSAVSLGLPPTMDVKCQGFVQVGNAWVPTTTLGPVTVHQVLDQNTSQYVSEYCDFQFDYSTTETPGAQFGTWFWDYIRGRWPQHRAGSIIAGATMPMGGAGHPGGGGHESPVVACQQVLIGGLLTAERILVLGGPAGAEVQAFMVDALGRQQGSARSLSPGQYAEIGAGPNGQELLPPKSIPAIAAESDPNGPAHFARIVNLAAAARHLPDGVP